MLARIRKSAEEKDQGFTLIELLVVMIIIGILAAIAIPVFLNQRKKAVDTAAKSDVSTIGKEIATYFVDNTAVPTVTATAGRVHPERQRHRQAEQQDGHAGVLGRTNDTDWCVAPAAHRRCRHPVERLLLGAERSLDHLLLTRVTNRARPATPDPSAT